MVELRHLFGLAHNVMTDEGAAEAVLAGVGKAAMHELAVEEEDIARLHQYRFRLHPLRDGHSHVCKTLTGVGLHRTQDGQYVGIGHHLQTAIFLVAIVQRHSGRNARARLDFQIILVLVQGLSSTARRFELEHRLHSVGFHTKQIGHPII